MADGDPALLPSMFLDHLIAGADALETVEMDSQDRDTLAEVIRRLQARLERQ